MTQIYLNNYWYMITKKMHAVRAFANICMKFICFSILMWLIVSSVKAANIPVYPEVQQEEVPDTSFNRNDPSLIYTTREYYFDLQPYTYGSMVIKDFSMLITFNIGVTMKDEIKQLGFKEADMDFSIKQGSGGFVSQTFSKYDNTFTRTGNKISITFYPDKPKTASTAKTATASTSKSSAVTKCEFTGVVKNAGVTGMFTFYFSSGDPVQIQFNPGLK